MKRSREKEADGKAMAQFVLRDIFFRRSSLKEFRSVVYIDRLRAEYVPSAVSKTIKCVSAEHELVLLEFHC